MSSKELEILVTHIQKQLTPDAKVQHNIKLPSRTTSTQRQIDVLVRQHIGQYEIMIIIDAKDYKRPVDVKGVEEFYGLVKDVGANKGVLVCPKGFTKAAKERATGFLIDLYRPVDTGEHKWKTQISLPTICDFRTAKIAFSLIVDSPQPFLIQDNFYNAIIYNKNKISLGIPLDISIDKWSKGVFPTEVGVHQNINLFDEEEVFMDNGYGSQIPITINISLRVEKQLFYGQMPISKISGFRNELTNHVITNAFTIGLLDPHEIIEKWKPVNDQEALPMPPVLTLNGLVGWG